MKSTIGKIVGKAIAGVVVAYNSHEPRKQVFLQFHDGTYLELWGESFNCASAVDQGGMTEILAYTNSVGSSRVDVYPPKENNAAAP